MIKKVIIYILVLSLAFVIFLQPVSAADTYGQYVNLLDYCGIDGTSSNSFSFSGSRTVNYNFRDTLGAVAIHAIEITYAFSGNPTNLSSITFGGSSISFTERSVGNGVFRVRCNAGGSLGSLFTLVFANAGTSNVNILSFNCYLVSTSDYSLSGVISSGTNSTSFYPGSFSNLTATTSSGNCVFRVEIDAWRNYDQITLDGMLTCDNVSSIDVVLEDNTSTDEWNIPLKTNFISAGDTQDSYHTIYNFNVYADLSDVDRSTIPDSTLVFVFSVVPISNSYPCYLQLDDARGYIFSGDLDGNARMLLALYIMIRQQTGDISTSIGSFEDSFVDLFSEFVSKYSDHTEFIENFLTGFEELMGQLYGDDGFYFQIVYYPLLEIIRLLTSSSDGTTSDEMQNAGQELAGLGQQIASGTPQVDISGDISLGDIPDDGSGVLASTIFNFLWSSDYILSMLISVVGIATLGYVFFGKKG